MKPRVVNIVPAYPDIPPYAIMLMDYKEIIAEKVHAIITRNKSRDVYDLWVLLKRGYAIDYAIVDREMAIYEDAKKLSKAIIKEKIREKEGDWISKMRDLLYADNVIPKFSEVYSFLLLRHWFPQSHELNS